MGALHCKHRYPHIALGMEFGLALWMEERFRKENDIIVPETPLATLQLDNVFQLVCSA
jgi:hypothetical protein